MLGSLLEILVLVFERLVWGCVVNLFMFISVNGSHKMYNFLVVSQLIRGDTLFD